MSTISPTLLASLASFPHFWVSEVAYLYGLIYVLIEIIPFFRCGREKAYCAIDQLAQHRFGIIAERTDASARSEATGGTHLDSSRVLKWLCNLLRGFNSVKMGLP